MRRREWEDVKREWETERVENYEKISSARRSKVRKKLHSQVVKEEIFLIESSKKKETFLSVIKSNMRVEEEKEGEWELTVDGSN